MIPPARAGPSGPTPLAGRDGAVAAGAALATRAVAERALDGRHDARARVEEALLHLRPAAEPELADGEQALRLHEAGPDLDDRPVAVLRPDRLRLRRPQEREERARRRLRGAALRQRDRVLDQDRLPRNDVRRGQAVGLREQRLVLVVDQDVAAALREGGEGVTRALVLR